MTGSEPFTTEDKPFTEDISIVDKKIETKFYYCPICKKKYTNNLIANDCLLKCLPIKVEVNSTDIKEYVTKCGCKFASIEQAEYHMQLQKECCGYFKSNYRGEEYYYFINHVSGIPTDKTPEISCGICINSKHMRSVNNEKYSPISSDLIFYKTRFGSKKAVSLNKESKRISKEEFEQKASECISLIHDNLLKGRDCQ